MDNGGWTIFCVNFLINRFEKVSCTIGRSKKEWDTFKKRFTIKSLITDRVRVRVSVLYEQLGFEQAASFYSVSQPNLMHEPISSACTLLACFRHLQ